MTRRGAVTSFTLVWIKMEEITGDGNVADRHELHARVD